LEGGGGGYLGVESYLCRKIHFYKAFFLRFERVELREGDDCWFWKPEAFSIPAKHTSDA